MPALLWAFFIALSAAVGPPTIKGLVTPPDASMRSKHGKPAPQEYYTRISSPRFDKPGVCTFTITAWATRNTLTRLQVQGNEQLLDWSWQWDADVPFGMRGEGMVVEFIDPVTRLVVATHTLAESCTWVPGAAMTDWRQP